jgi:hypothetical protein
VKCAGFCIYVFHNSPRYWTKFLIGFVNVWRIREEK